MKFALNTSTIRPVPLLQKISIAARAGYTGIELWHEDLDEFIRQGGGLPEVSSMLADFGLKVPTTIYMAGWFEAPDSGFEDSLAGCARKMEQACRLDAEFIIASPPPGRADVQLGAARYRRLLELGRSIGVRPSMEFLGFVEQVNRIEDAIEILELAADPSGTTILDPFHIFRGGGSMESILLLKSAQIAVSHFNDAPTVPERAGQTDADRVLPGDGHLDLKRYVSLLRQTGYDGWLFLELFNEELWRRDPLEVARVGLEKMRAIAG